MGNLNLILKKYNIKEEDIEKIVKLNDIYYWQEEDKKGNVVFHDRYNNVNNICFSKKVNIIHGGKLYKNVYNVHFYSNGEVSSITFAEPQKMEVYGKTFYNIKEVEFDEKKEIDYIVFDEKVNGIEAYNKVYDNIFAIKFVDKKVSELCKVKYDILFFDKNNQEIK